MANYEGHRNISEAALRAIPDWQQTLLINERERFLSEYCMYGDNYFINPTELAPYVVLPSGRLPMDPWELRIFRKDEPGRDYYICGYYDLMREIFSYFSRRCIDSVLARDWTTYAKCLGTLAHVIEDCCTPAHSVGTQIGTDFRLIRDMYPPPDATFNAVQLHSVLESNIPAISVARLPKGLGRTPDEIAFNMLDDFTDLLEKSISYILPLLEAFYHRDMRRFRQLMAKCMAPSAELIADFMSTTIHQGYCSESFPVSRECFLDRLTMPERSAWASAPYAYSKLRQAPHSLNDQYECLPLTLKSINGVEMFEHGFGTGVPLYIKYELPPDVFTHFECSVGLSALLSSDTPVELKIFGDGRLLWCCRLEPGSVVLPVKICIANIQKFEIKAESLPLDFGCRVHLVIGNPILR